MNWLRDVSKAILGSPYGVNQDWRGYLKEGVEPIRQIAKEFGVRIDPFYSIDEDGYDDDGPADLTITAGDRSESISVDFIPNAGSFDEVVSVIQSASSDLIVCYKLCYYADSDAYCYAILSPERWENVKTVAGSSFSDIFDRIL